MGILLNNVDRNAAAPCSGATRHKSSLLDGLYYDPEPLGAEAGQFAKFNEINSKKKYLWIANPEVFQHSNFIARLSQFQSILKHQQSSFFQHTQVYS